VFSSQNIVLFLVTPVRNFIPIYSLNCMVKDIQNMHLRALQDRLFSRCLGGGGAPCFRTRPALHVSPPLVKETIFFIGFNMISFGANVFFFYLQCKRKMSQYEHPTLEAELSTKYCLSARCAYAAKSWVKISTYLHSEPFLSITFIIINRKLLIIFVQNPNVLCHVVLRYHVLVTSLHLCFFICLFTFLY
jgi:hypothetical protein